MSRRTVVWVTITAVLVGALVTGALYERGRSNPKSQAGGSRGQAASSQGAASPATSSPGTSGQLAGSPVGGPTKPLGANSPASKPGAGSTSNSGPTAAGRADPVSDPKVKLAPVTSPPSNTLAIMSRSMATTGTELDVVFVPYGLGPSSPSPTVVAQLKSVKLTKGTPVKLPLQGRNVLLYVAPATKTPVVNGGTYSGKVVIAAQGTAVVLQLNSARPIKK